jgi:hypothetical protein
VVVDVVVVVVVVGVVVDVVVDVVVVVGGSVVVVGGNVVVVGGGRVVVVVGIVVVVGATVVVVVGATVVVVVIGATVVVVVDATVVVGATVVVVVGATVVVVVGATVVVVAGVVVVVVAGVVVVGAVVVGAGGSVVGGGGRVVVVVSTFSEARPSPVVSLPSAARKATTTPAQYVPATPVITVTADDDAVKLGSSTRCSLPHGPTNQVAATADQPCGVVYDAVAENDSPGATAVGAITTPVTTGWAGGTIVRTMGDVVRPQTDRVTESSPSATSNSTTSSWPRRISRCTDASAAPLAVTVPTALLGESAVHTRSGSS